MKRLPILLVFVFMLTVLSGCTNSELEGNLSDGADSKVEEIDSKEEKTEVTEDTKVVDKTEDAEESEKTSDKTKEEQPEEKVKPDTSLVKLRRDAQDAGCPPISDCAVAYLGYVEEGSAEAVQEYVKSSEYIAEYPFLEEIKEEQIVFAGGGEIYCIVPAIADESIEGSITVSSLIFTEEGELKKDAVLYQGDEKPILLVCNQSDIICNSLVQVTVGEKYMEFSPYLSLEDGSLAVQPDDVIIFNFTK